ncbi:hypothetical protein TraAM80_00037 [Trypanosoma rangeli]|uniref:PHD-type domain-containing protein n=1 Tax=Trypanosoma rangeli TaxID=5698 RepID=A0A422P586_TRYRA|nr:uncharacterized protein TraAM80_00037 [Trypanosoma rangeli]RNF12880.1 hypothetical protein TraAM80_00037 [Trypanosoma rangeli]|eukprot:RNF12880.1 hypothetical protein TraAM80_00037 [Trypanosoma rangeli]
MAKKGKTKKAKAGDESLRIALNCDTVLPLVLVENMDEVRAKYKPYKIIQEELSDDGMDDKHNFFARRSSSQRLSRKRGRPSFTIDRVPKSSALPSARVGWGAQALRESTPYGLLRRVDLFDRCSYIMDHEDYVWCNARNVVSAFFTKVITKLEKSYVMHLGLAARRDEASTNLDASANGTYNNDNNAVPKQSDKRTVEICGVCLRPEFLEEAERFLQCRRCGCKAHVKCWILEALPPNSDDWLCPCCVGARREKGIGRCYSCGRKGGVMLPFVSGHEWQRKGAAANSFFCHIVCALTFGELTIDVKQRVVHPAKRARKSDRLAYCVFCHSESAGARERCHHPRCFESMHPSCAQQAGTLECYRAPHHAHTSGPWDGCHMYCRAHFGVVLDSELGLARMGEIAEAEALLRVTMEDFVGTTRPTRRGRPPNAKFIVATLEAVKKYWVEKRLQRLHEGLKKAKSIREGQIDIASVSLRPEVMKITPTEVRLARFVCLIPELQHYVNATVEGVLPIPDEEYDDVEEYRKNRSRTRYANNSSRLYEKMQSIASHIHVFSELAELLHQQALLRQELVDTDLQLLEARCPWIAVAR